MAVTMAVVVLRADSAVDLTPGVRSVRLSGLFGF